jgi:hypothetical protein
MVPLHTPLKQTSHADICSWHVRCGDCTLSSSHLRLDDLNTIYTDHACGSYSLYLVLRVVVTVVSCPLLFANMGLFFSGLSGSLPYSFAAVLSACHILYACCFLGDEKDPLSCRNTLLMNCSGQPVLLDYLGSMDKCALQLYWSDLFTWKKIHSTSSMVYLIYCEECSEGCTLPMKQRKSGWTSDFFCLHCS